MRDLLSDALNLGRARFAITGGFRAGGEWAMLFRPEAPLKLDAIVQGSCWCLIEGGEPFVVAAGEAIVLNGVDEFVLASDPGLRPVPASRLLTDIGEDGLARVGSTEEVVVLGGHVEVNQHGQDLLLRALPRVSHVRDPGRDPGQDVGGLHALLGALIQEGNDLRPGAELARSGYTQLLLVQVLRLLIRQGTPSNAGWFSLLTDPALLPAVAGMHERPEHAWDLNQLASLAAMSRSSFAARFKRVAGIPPLTYLSQWRLRLAGQALTESEDTVAAIAQRLGYASESSFSHAFRRSIGTSPGLYRRAGRIAARIDS